MTTTTTTTDVSAIATAKTTSSSSLQNKTKQQRRRTTTRTPAPNIRHRFITKLLTTTTATIPTAFAAAAVVSSCMTLLLAFRSNTNTNNYPVVITTTSTTTTEAFTMTPVLRKSHQSSLLPASIGSMTNKKHGRTLSSLTDATASITTEEESSFSSSSSYSSFDENDHDDSDNDNEGTTTTRTTTTTTMKDDESKSLKRALNVVDNNDNYYPNFNRNPWIVGHRGCLYDELENTRSGFDRCAEMGCDGVELDVFLLKCNTLVVFHGVGSDEHPGDLWDYCGVKGSILDYTYEEAVEKLTFNPSFEGFPCPKDAIVRGSIPTLDDVLRDAKKSGLHIKIELKETPVEPVLELVESLDMIDQISFSSFDLERLALLRKLRPDRTTYKIGALFNAVPDDFIEQALAVGANEVHLRYDTITVENIQRIHDNGMGSLAWLRGPVAMNKDSKERYKDVGNEDDSMYETMLRTGVQQMCVNRPDVLIDMRRRYLATAQQNNNGNDIPTTTKKAMLFEDDVFQVAQ